MSNDQLLVTHYYGLNIKTMNWGLRIVAAFGTFMALIITLVVVSMRQDISLVAEDYYVQEIAYQDQIDRMKNHQQSDGMDISFDKKNKRLILNHKSNNAKIAGEVLFFRPSDAGKDRKAQLSLSENRQQVFDIQDLQPGLWKVKVTWTHGDDEFYHEKTIVI